MRRRRTRDPHDVHNFGDFVSKARLISTISVTLLRRRHQLPPTPYRAHLVQAALLVLAPAATVSRLVSSIVDTS